MDQNARKPLQNLALLQLTGKTKKWKNAAILSDNYHIVPAGEIWRLWSSRHQANQPDWQKKIQEATDEKLSAFLSYEF